MLKIFERKRTKNHDKDLHWGVAFTQDLARRSQPVMMTVMGTVVKSTSKFPSNISESVDLK
jgi:hypothetical protein